MAEELGLTFNPIDGTYRPDTSYLSMGLPVPIDQIGGTFL